MLLVIEWGSLAVKAGQFILSFAILVTLHEMGHFLTAKWFKCRVEKFYLFFNPGFSLWKKQIGETEYGIGWVPLGGYVKIAGMMDESMDKAQMELPPKPDEFRSKPAWQRLIIMIGGVVVNVLLAMVIFIGITWHWGDEYLTPKHLKYGLYADSLGKKIGLIDGDNIIAVNGKAIDNINTIESEIVFNEAKELTILRNGKEEKLGIPAGFIKELSQNKLGGFVIPQFPTVVDSVLSSAVFTDSSKKLIKGDTLIGINRHYFNSYGAFVKVRDLYKDSLVQLNVIRGMDTLAVNCFLKKGLVGFAPIQPEKMFGTEKKTYSFVQSIPVGFTRCFATLTKYIAGIKQLFTGKVNPNDSVGGIISIGNAYSGVWDWQKFWTLTGIFSIVLAFMNILPIPALDGGHALFTIAEIITGKKPNDKFMEYAQMVGMVLLLALMAYGLGLDIWRIFK